MSISDKIRVIEKLEADLESPSPVFTLRQAFRLLLEMLREDWQVALSVEK